MISNFELRDHIRDQLIAKAVTDEVIEEAKDSLLDIVNDLGLTEKDIPSPLPYKVRRYLVAWICNEVCMNMARTYNGAMTHGGDVKDVWADKKRMWEQELERNRGSLTTSVFTGAERVRYGTVSIYRG